MRIAILTEMSTKAKNQFVVKALEGRPGHEIHNLGMKDIEGEPELNYIDNGLLTALLLNSGAVDFIVSGCGTGQGYFNSACMYPGVFCGMILDPADAYIFPQINAGNCISLALNKGFGWGGDVNLRMIFDELLSVEFGGGYPPERKAPQEKFRNMLTQVSKDNHLDMPAIFDTMNQDVVKHCFTFPGVKELMDQNADPKNPTTIAYYAKLKTL
ncbi:RpiB/LacA/LacB family sugar-phosphate isomerase [Oscillospiraceae bacterium MB08-C2-2]|nr:RpiB/LacA/LacB family sugar-phosphate isomerase [Oscillospiraceae bacterium MB08-C2-2]